MAPLGRAAAVAALMLLSSAVGEQVCDGDSTCLLQSQLELDPQMQIMSEEALDEAIKSRTSINCGDLKLPTFDGKAVALCRSFLAESRLHEVLSTLLDSTYTSHKVDIADIGGWSSFRLAQHEKVREVYTYEASKTTHSFLEKTLKANKLDNVHVINQEVGVIDGGKYTDKDASNTVDRLQETGAINKRVGILHLDVDGKETALLSGAMKMLKGQRPIIVTKATVPEAHHGNLKEMLMLLSDVKYSSFSVKEDCAPKLPGASKSKCRNLIHIPDENKGLQTAIMNTNKAHVTALRHLPRGSFSELDVGP